MTHCEETLCHADNFTHVDSHSATQPLVFPHSDNVEDYSWVSKLYPSLGPLKVRFMYYCVSSKIWTRQVVWREHVQSEERDTLAANGLWALGPACILVSPVGDVTRGLGVSWLGLPSVCVQGKEGAFLVRDSSHKGSYTVSLFSLALKWVQKEVWKRLSNSIHIS